MFCVKFGWKWSSGSGEEGKMLKVYDNTNDNANDNKDNDDNDGQRLTTTDNEQILIREALLSLPAQVS